MEIQCGRQNGDTFLNEMKRIHQHEQAKFWSTIGLLLQNEQGQVKTILDFGLGIGDLWRIKRPICIPVHNKCQKWKQVWLNRWFHSECRFVSEINSLEIIISHFIRQWSKISRIVRLRDYGTIRIRVNNEQ
jgi:hypothetical protein